MADTEILTLAQVAEMLHVNRYTVQQWIYDGVIPGYSLPGHRRVYVKHSELMACLKPVYPSQGGAAEHRAANEQLLTLDEAAEMLHVHRRTLRRRIYAGLIPAYRLAGRRRMYIKRSELLGALQSWSPSE